GDRRLNEGPGEGADTEMTGFFAQLAAADLTGAVDPTVGANRGTIYSWETGVWPESPIGGGFHAGWTDGVNANGFPQIEGTGIPRRGLWLLLHDAPGSGLGGGSRNPRILQPSHALRIDTKMDDGRPDTGFVRGANGACVNT